MMGSTHDQAAFDFVAAHEEGWVAADAVHEEAFVGVGVAGGEGFFRS